MAGLTELGVGVERVSTIMRQNLAASLAKDAARLAVRAKVGGHQI
jgi:hypothetical protein